MSPRLFSFSTCSLVAMGVFSYLITYINSKTSLGALVYGKRGRSCCLQRYHLISRSNRLAPFFQLYYLNLHLFCSKHEDYRRKQVLFEKHLPTVLLAHACTRTSASFRFFAFTLHPVRKRTENQIVAVKKKVKASLHLIFTPFPKGGGNSRRTARSGAKKGNVNTCLHPAFTAKRLFSTPYAT